MSEIEELIILGDENIHIKARITRCSNCPKDETCPISVFVEASQKDASSMTDFNQIASVVGIPTRSFELKGADSSEPGAHIVYSCSTNPDSGLVEIYSVDKEKLR